MSQVRLVIFDCDGVLIDSEVISARILIEDLARHDVAIDAGYVAQHFLGRSFPTVRDHIRTAFGVELPSSFEDSYRTRLIDTFQFDLRPMPHIHAALGALDLPYHLATSSSPPRLARSLDITGLADLFSDRTSTASEVARGKPAPDLFLHVAARYAIPPQQCLVIEDSIAGIMAAQAAGMPVWRFTGGSHLSQLTNGPERAGGAALSFDSFADFPARLAGLTPPAQTKDRAR